jgi:hypothetical protein
MSMSYGTLETAESLRPLHCSSRPPELQKKCAHHGVWSVSSLKAADQLRWHAMYHHVLCSAMATDLVLALLAADDASQS